MQNSHDADQPANIMHVARQSDDRMGGGLHQEAVHVLLMPACPWPELMRQGEDHVVVRHRQELLLPLVEPCLRVAGVAFRATAVTTRMIRIMLPTAVAALKDMAPHGRGTAAQYLLERPSMARQHLVAERSQILRAVTSKDIGYFDHGGLAEP
jgi:hypothetical protein